MRLLLALLLSIPLLAQVRLPRRPHTAAHHGRIAHALHRGLAHRQHRPRLSLHQRGRQQ